MAKDGKAVSPATLERELRRLRRALKRYEGEAQGVPFPRRKPRRSTMPFSTLQERLAVHLEAAKEFDHRLWLADEVVGDGDAKPSYDSPRSPSP